MKVNVRKGRDEKTKAPKFQAYTYSPVNASSGWHALERSAINELHSILKARGVR